MFCTTEDVRKVLQDSQFSGALAEDNNDIVTEQIEAVSELVEKATKRYWYDPTEGTAETRQDEYSFPQGGAMIIDGDLSPKEMIQVVSGDQETGPAYARIRLDRKDVQTLNELLVLNADGTLTDWVSSNDYDTGVGITSRGSDAWVRVNNGGVSYLNIDVTKIDDEIPSLANSVYAGIEYGTEGLVGRVKKGTAALVASDLILDDELTTAVPDDGQLIGVETKGERFGRLGVQKLEPDIVEPSYLDTYK